nr:helix-turn-helix domain-containing protein [Petroclostridium xylanilyticum]
MYNAESYDVLYTVSEVAELIKTNTKYVYDIIKAGLLPGLKLGSMKVTRSALLEFLNKYQGYDLTDPFNIKPIEQFNDEK